MVAVQLAVSITSDFAQTERSSEYLRRLICLVGLVEMDIFH